MGLPGSSNLATTVVLGLVFALIASHVDESFGFGVGDLLGSGSQPTGSGPSAPSGLGMQNSAPSGPGLKVGFYTGKCLNNFNVEAFIESLIRSWLPNEPRILAWLLRMQFHDCYINGCDASILIDGPSTEKKASPNLSVRGYDVIDQIKTALEARCGRGIVSCADIIAIATKAAIKWGGGPDYAVETGRRDGIRSEIGDVILPDPSMDAGQCISAFQPYFTVEEMVALLGGHSVGTARCRFFQNRLYQGRSQYDPKMDEQLRADLKRTCPADGSRLDAETLLDQNPRSAYILDSSFYNQISRNRGVLPVDQALARDSRTSGYVNQMQDNNVFKTKFANAMVKLQRYRVITDPRQGQIRTNCRRFN